MLTTTYASPLGEILIAADAKGLTGLWFEGQAHFASTLPEEPIVTAAAPEAAVEDVAGSDAESGTPAMGSANPADGAASAVLQRTWAWLNAYFAGQEPQFTPPLHVIGTSFQREVWYELLSIPRGETRSYSEVAARLSQRRNLPGVEKTNVTARSVASAVAHNPISIVVPCHRVVAADGSLTGYAGGLQRKEQLLKMEGAL